MVSNRLSKNRKEGSGADAAAVRREVEDRDRKAAFGAGRTAQIDHRCQPVGEQRHALLVRLHAGAARGAGIELARADAGLGLGGTVGASAEDHGADRTIEFRDRDHQRGFDRRQALARLRPDLTRLEFGDESREIGNVERLQESSRRARIAIGRATDEREAGE